ncbi:NAD(P)-binding domain-containing protein [Streptomyces sp. CA-250714]|uniref:NAD(P)-binding domain-containing protein n=1 Tax=Streptomyces sp. CA-250714 TaxID=3240060 RepID=UPI003D935C03
MCADNQEVVDRSEMVIIAVRREDRHDALAGVRVDDDKIVVNVMAGVGNDDLRQTLTTGAPLGPGHPPAGHPRTPYLVTLTSWAAGHGVASEDADRYVRSLFQGVGRALSDETRSLHQLAADHETPNGNNERIRTTWFTPTNSEALTRALDALLTDLTGDSAPARGGPR